MIIDIIDLDPRQTINSLWISDIFECRARSFDGKLSKNTFPLFIVHGSKNVDRENRTISSKIFDYLNKHQHPFGLIHILDENYDHDISIYNLDFCKIIFRQYFRPKGGMLSFIADYAKSFLLPTYQSNNTVKLYRRAADFKIRIFGEYGVWKFMKRQYLPSLKTEINVHCIPLGYTDKFKNVFDYKMLSENKNVTVGINKRKYKWSFCGQGAKKDRPIMIDNFKKITPNYIYESDKYFNIEMLSGKGYFEVLIQSIFVPCPLGNINTDTYRLYEALEAGSIPIILDNYAFQPYGYYKSLLGDHPIPVFSSWEKAASFVVNVSDDSIEDISKKVSDWYRSLKLNASVNVRFHLNDAIKNNVIKVDSIYQ